MKGNMYSLSAGQYNPFVGCHHDCDYCKPSFQAQVKRWAKNHCEKCYLFEPHEHPERLKQPLPKTRYMQFIFTCASGDIAYCSTPYLEQILDRIRSEPNKTFLIQSKNPATFRRVYFPKNVILGTTIETNRTDVVAPHSKAPPPYRRVQYFKDVEHPFKMVTIEPVMDFDIEEMIKYVTVLKPIMVWMGYDSKDCRLPEPPLMLFKQLHWELARRGFKVILKTVRDPWWWTEGSLKNAKEVTL